MEIILVCMYIFLGNGTIAMLEVNLPLLLSTKLGLLPIIIGLVYGFNTLIYTLSMYILGKVSSKIGRKKGLVCGLILMGNLFFNLFDIMILILFCRNTVFINVILIENIYYILSIWGIVGIGMAFSLMVIQVLKWPGFYC